MGSSVSWRAARAAGPDALDDDMVGCSDRAVTSILLSMIDTVRQKKHWHESDDKMAEEVPFPQTTF